MQPTIPPERFAALLEGAPLVLELGGELSSARNLNVTLLDGRVLRAFPSRDLLPTTYSAVLSIDPATREARFAFGGVARAQDGEGVWTETAFDKLVEPLRATLPSAARPILKVSRSTSAFDFALELDPSSGAGSWSYLAQDAVPTFPREDVAASGVVRSAVLAPVEYTSALMLREERLLRESARWSA